jgi:hypothetical protein
MGVRKEFLKRIEICADNEELRKEFLKRIEILQL